MNAKYQPIFERFTLPSGAQLKKPYYDGTNDQLLLS